MIKPQHIARTYPMYAKNKINRYVKRANIFVLIEHQKGLEPPYLDFYAMYPDYLTCQYRKRIWIRPWSGHMRSTQRHVHHLWCGIKACHNNWSPSTSKGRLSFKVLTKSKLQV